jgi:hypothetical protein
MNELLEKIQKERSITFPPIPLPPIEVVDLNEGLLIEEEKEEQISQFNAANSLKKTQNGEYMHDIHNKIDKLSSQLEQVLANQILIMEKLNILKRE